MSNDLGQFETAKEDGEWLEVLHPVTGQVIRDSEDVALQICLLGKDSKQYRKAQRSITERRMKSRSKASRMNAEAIEIEAIDVLVACVTDWKGLGSDGVELVCNPANARKVFTEHLWLREQVDEFVDDRGNFMKG